MNGTELLVEIVPALAEIVLAYIVAAALGSLMRRIVEDLRDNPERRNQ